MAPTPDNWLQSGLLVIGHGNTNAPESTQLIQYHVKEISKLGRFQDVRAGFLKTAPLANAQLAQMTNKTIYAVPCFASPGNLTKFVIPEFLKLNGNETHRDGQTINYCEPIGNHPLIAERLAELVNETLTTSGLAANETTLIVVGHGSSYNPQSEIDTRSVADQLSELSPIKKTQALFLDQAPNLVDWQKYCDTEKVIVISNLFSGGAHETKDVPELLGIDPALTQKRFEDAAPLGPIHIDHKELWLCPPIAADAAIQSAILKRAEECA